MKKRLVMVGIFLIFIVFLLNFDKIKFVFSMVNIYFEQTKLKEENIDSDQIKDNPLQIITENKKSIDETMIENSYSEDIINENPDNQNITIKNNSSSNIQENKIKNNNTKNQSSNVEVKSLVEIASIYNKKFEALQNSYFTALDNLIATASVDYNKGTISSSEIASKYISKGTDLEKSCDKEINSILKNLETELISNGHDTTLARDVKSYYKSFKKSKKSELLNKAKQYR